MATINCAAKCRAYPNRGQETTIIKTLGSCRYIYNHMLDRNDKIYKRRKEHLSYVDMQNLLPGMKKYTPWLKEADSQALKYACRQLDTAYKKFFKREAEYPKYHSRKGRQSYTTTNASSIKVSEDRKKVKLPCLGWVRVRGLRIQENANVKYATVNIEPDGSIYISITYSYDIEIVPAEKRTFKALGLDYKSDGLFVDSEGRCADMPHWFRESQAELSRQQRILSRKQGSRKGEKKSNTWVKQHKKVVKLQAKIKNQRRDFLEKMSRFLADNYDMVAVEDLDMSSMANKGFGNGKATMDNGYGRFRTMLDYKLAWNGKQLMAVDKWYPSSQICSCCGYKNQDTKNLNIRKWTCPNCGAKHDRDINAAINIREEALRMLADVS